MANFILQQLFDTVLSNGGYLDGESISYQKDKYGHLDGNDYYATFDFLASLKERYVPKAEFDAWGEEYVNFFKFQDRYFILRVCVGQGQVNQFVLLDDEAISRYKITWDTAIDNSYDLDAQPYEELEILFIEYERQETLRSESMKNDPALKQLAKEWADSHIKSVEGKKKKRLFDPMVEELKGLNIPEVTEIINRYVAQTKFKS